MKRNFSILLIVIFGVATFAISHPVKPEHNGKISVAWQDYPSSLLSYLGYDDYSLAVSNLVLEPLLSRDLETRRFSPRLANGWSLSPDKSKITLDLNAAAKFSNGSPVTAKDVCFTLDTVKNPTHRTSFFQEQFSSLTSCRVITSKKVELRVRPDFANLDKISELLILPESTFRGKDFNSAFQDHFLGSGPYTISRAVRGQSVTLTRNPDYWGANEPINRGKYRLGEIHFRVIHDPQLQLEMLKKGEIDYLYFLSSKIWSVDTNGPLFDSGKIKKLKVENALPHSLVALAWNLRRPIFSDARVRLALSLLLDRERMIRDLFYGNYVPTTGIFHSRSPFHAVDLKPVPFDLKKARQLLDQAGWTKLNARGVRTKDGKDFSIEILTGSTASSRYLSLYQEALKRAGIEMKVKTVDWATAQELSRKHEFDGWELVQSRDLNPTYLTECWSSIGTHEGGCNVSGYASPKTDALIARFSKSFREKERHEILREIEREIAADHPITLLWEQTYLRVAYWDKFSFDGKGYRAYSTWWNIFHDWEAKTKAGTL